MGARVAGLVVGSGFTAAATSALLFFYDARLVERKRLEQVEATRQQLLARVETLRLRLSAAQHEQ